MKHFFKGAQRGCLRFTGRCITGLLAVFCLVSGLVAGSPPVLLSGVVKNSLTGNSLANIKVIYTEFEEMCPLYGTTATCSEEITYSDSTLTFPDGWFGIPVDVNRNIPYKKKLVFRSMDTAIATSFRADSLYLENEYSMPVDTFFEISLIPSNFLFTVKGTVRDINNMPLESIQVKLIKTYMYEHEYDYTEYDTVKIKSAVTDAEGQYLLEIEDSWEDVLLLAKDIDGAGNGGLYLPKTTVSFDVNAITPVTMDIAMTRDAVSAHESNGIKAKTDAPKLTVLSGHNGIITMMLNGARHAFGKSAYVMDVKGRIIAPLPVSPGGTIEWNTKAVSAGFYYVHVQIDGANMIAPVIVK
jgi:hypothetical protein